MSSFADALLALPSLPRTAMVFGRSAGIGAELEALGVRRLSPGAAERPDVVLAPGAATREILGPRPAALIVGGRRGARRLARAGYGVRLLLIVPSAERPELLSPIRPSLPLRYALWRTPPARRWKRLRNRLALPLLTRGVSPPGRLLGALATREQGLPFLVAEAVGLGVPPDSDWLLFPGQGDVLSRGAFHLFAPGAAEPEWVLKYSRVGGYSDSFERDEQGLAIARAAGACATAHAPRPLGRLRVGSVNAALETAAVGQPLAAYLATGAPRAEKLGVIDGIAEWLLDLAVETATGPERLEPERQRLRAEVVSGWGHAGATGAIVEKLPPLRGVLQHNDLGTWNIVVRPSAPRAGFTALDWEGARAVGMPIWDLWYFLQHALAQLDGASGLSEGGLAAREEHSVRLFRGELDTSATLFQWTRRLAAVGDVPPRAVGPLATLCFLHHGLSQGERDRAVRDHRPGGRSIDTLSPRVARRWLSEPRLGPGWDLWR